MRALRNPVALWLLLCCLTVAWMVGLGGWTRLTESGLSITEWAPVKGALPPMGEDAWQRAFDAYRATPEYKALRSADMGLADYKRIYLPEYLHRLSGRIVGAIFFLPLLFFWQKKMLSPREKKRMALIGGLGALQGLVGWLMVRSGLKDSPYVSHGWLAFHLGMALAVFALLWTGFLERLKTPRRFLPHMAEKTGFAWLCLQIIWGALVAGKDAGHAFGTEFPTMRGEWLPVASMPNNVWEYFYDPMALHAAHRLSGAGLCAFACLYAALLWAKKSPRAMAWAVFAAGLCLQIALGAATVMSGVAIGLASAHQVFALVLFALYLYLGYKVDQEKCKD